MSKILILFIQNSNFPHQFPIRAQIIRKLTFTVAFSVAIQVPRTLPSSPSSDALRSEVYSTCSEKESTSDPCGRLKELLLRHREEKWFYCG